MTVKTYNGIAAASVKTLNGVAAASVKTWNGEPWPIAGFPFANVKALLHFNGADASTTFTDVIGATWTARGNAQIDTAQSKFGGASGLFDGTGDWIDTPDSANWALGTNNFTIECWIRPATSTGLRGISGQCSGNAAINSNNSFQIYQNNLSVNAFCGQSSLKKGDVLASGALTLNTWSHIRYVRNGDRFDLYINGISAGNVTETATVNNSTSVLTVGTIGTTSGLDFNGHIDDFRLVIGSAVCTGNFTPPAAQLPDA